MADVWLWVNKRTDDALAFFERLKAGLRSDGVIIIKENVCASGFVVDKVCTLPFCLSSFNILKHEHREDVMHQPERLSTAAM